MGLISKVADKMTGSSHKAEPETAHAQPGLDNRTGTTASSHTSTGSAASTAPHAHHSSGAHTTGGGSSTSGQTGNYGVMDPNHKAAGHGTGTQGTSAIHSGTGLSSTTTGAHTTGSSTHHTDDSRTTGEKVKDAVLPGHHSSTTTSSTHETSSTSRGSTGSSDIDRQGGRLGELNLNERDLSSAKGEHTVKHAAPVVAEHVHDKYEHVDKTRVEELRQKTEVTQTVQPVRDEVKHSATHERVDHGLEVHEHGHRGLDREAEAELARKREQIAREHRSTHDEETRQTSLRPDVNVHQRTNVVEEVVPVIEKDIYRPHEIEHVKHEVHVHHERPHVTGTTVAKPISIHEYEKASGVKLQGLQSSDHATRDTLTTDKHAHGTHGGVTGGREGNVDTTSSYDNRSTTGTHGVGSHSTGDNRTMGEKIKDTVLPGHHSSSSSSSTTTTGSSATGYDNSRSTTTGTHGSTGMGSTTGTHNTGVSGQHSGVTGSNTYGDNRTTGEKVKDTVTPGHHNTQTGTHNTGVTGHTGVTGSNTYGDNRTTGEKVKDTVTPGHHNTQTGTRNTGVSGQHTGVTGSNSYGDNRTTGEKVKDTVMPGQHGAATGTHTGTTGKTTSSNQDARPLMDRLA